MVTTTHPRATQSAVDEPRPADVFVAFGISGDLAKVMTFRSLYRLEKRGRLDCPIVGVAFDDWSLAQWRSNAGAGVVMDTIVGPVLVAGTWSFDGRWRTYFAVGRTFAGPGR